MRSIKSLIPEFFKRSLRSYLHRKSFHRSQAGQDLWVIGEVFNGKREGFYLDIGAHDGVYLSNTYILEKKFKWLGICIEANPDSYSELNQNRNATCINECIDSRPKKVTFVKEGVFGRILDQSIDGPQDSELEVIEMTTKPLEQVLIECGCPKEIDYMSCDIEGAEESAFLDFPFDKYKFNCLTIERPTSKLKTLLVKNHYVEVKSIPGLDTFYIHKDFERQYLENVFKYYRKKRLIVSLN